MKNRVRGYGIYLWAGLTVWLATCDLPHQPGPMPRAIIDVAFEPGLNVLGVLRADNDSSSSFVHVQRATTTDEMYSDADIYIDNAEVVVECLTIADTVRFGAATDSVERGYYYAEDFQPDPGHRYRLTVRVPNLPVLSGETTVPPLPRVDSNSVELTPGHLQFEIEAASDNYQYEIYLIGTEGHRYQRYPVEADGTLEVRFQLHEKIGSLQILIIYTYDRNLAEYLNSPIAFMPQSFQEAIHTVENGYGCFGSLSMAVIPLTNLNP